MSSGLRREVNEILKTLKRDHGCEYTQANRGGHWKVTRPGYRPIFMSLTPSDHRAILNIKKDVRDHFGIKL